MRRNSFSKVGRLEISLDREQLLVRGNREGLLSLAGFIANVARLPYQLDDFVHKHIGFTWHEELSRKKLVIRLGKHPLTPPTNKKPGSGREVTVMLSRKW